MTQIGKMFGVMKQNVDDLQWVQFMVTSYLGGNYLYRVIEKEGQDLKPL